MSGSNGERPPAGGVPDEDYLPIAEHGLIGDLRTAALVGTDGRIDWLCAPRFDSPSVFGSLLDADRGGYWEITPTCPTAARHQFYFPDTTILITRMLTDDGIVEIQDFMPILREHDPGHRQRLVRRVVSVRGSMRMTVRIAPRMNYGRDAHRLDPLPDGVRFTSTALVLTVRANVPLDAGGAGPVTDAVGTFEIDEGQSALFVLETAEPRGDDGDGEPVGAEATTRLFDATVDFWRRWLRQSTYTGRWREMVHRSAMTLKLLTHEPTGAVIAAPTLGLPERIGGGRNWDYRYVWIRDAAFSLYALLRLGFTQEAEAFIGWLTQRLADSADGAAGPLHAVYSIDGHSRLPEEVLGHLHGYRGSHPVRAGNDASGQLQLDIYGELIDSVYLFNKYGKGISHESWTDLCDILDWLMEHWDSTDESIWETRAGRQNHTYSRLMCWVAVERMIRMARQRGLPADLGRWTATRDAIYHQIMARGWQPETRTFVQRLADKDADGPPETVLDAALLLMPMVKFVSPTDPRFLSTVEAVRHRLVADSLVFRYDPVQAPDGLDGTEGTFSICSFWWVEALARSGEIEQARLALEKMFTYANHVGLYSEQIGLTGQHLGNFPQAFTHLALISSALNLDRAMG
ncbi:glycoside hydrolase family 15 protein [Streptomyces tsukubensis]|uniref:Glucoamylase n=1 Tax=Streptomyces tsukubensis TaxID=83656 RepID=A0A1V4AA96_9ACTN|nr:glycoside hydrolase family 15 protein [Streptomyces tsukubensis]OON80039.1 glucoamylase [Streptomyces tsukubensis]QFR97273.1 glycoside hydrolase family 15 protein [Streptomyces tsukubensis]